MPKLKFHLEYHGGQFHGWQIQPGLRTVQGTLHEVIERVTRTKIRSVVGASRTDAGVHARGQVAHIWFDELPDIDRLVHSVGGMLNGELAITKVEHVPAGFHAQRDAVRKQYQYTIVNRLAPPALLGGLAWHVRAPLNIEQLVADARVVIGEHDFTSFRASGCSAPSPVKCIEESEIEVRGESIVYRVVGHGFLKQMIRIIVGTLIARNRGLVTLPMQEILEARDRRRAGPTAPAWGLCLDWIQY